MVSTASSLQGYSYSRQATDYLKIGLLSQEMEDVFGKDHMKYAGGVLEAYNMVERTRKIANCIPIRDIVTRNGSPHMISSKDEMIYSAPFADDAGGFTRMIYELLDSNLTPITVKLLDRVSELGSMTSHQMNSEFNHHTSSRQVNALASLGLLNIHHKVNGRVVTLTKAARNIFSPETKAIWEDLKKEDFRIDVW